MTTEEIARLAQIRDRLTAKYFNSDDMLWLLDMVDRLNRHIAVDFIPIVADDKIDAVFKAIDDFQRRIIDRIGAAETGLDELVVRIDRIDDRLAIIDSDIKLNRESAENLERRITNVGRSVCGSENA